MGSLEETFNSRVIRGSNFIAIDNVRGKVDSPAIESFLTEDTYSARTPYGRNVEIDPRRVIVQLTSNNAELTHDLANRSSSVRILKQADGHQYRRYSEGDILDRVRKLQPLYLGAVFAVVRAWHDAGQPQTSATSHDFRAWARRLDWIVQELFRLPPLLDGHLETKHRMRTPALRWLRDIAEVVRCQKRLGAPLRTNQILDLIAEAPAVDVPALAEGDDLGECDTRKKVLQAIGRRLGQCFSRRDEVRLDEIIVRRQVTHDPDRRRDSKEYTFASAPMGPTSYGRSSGAPIGADGGWRSGRGGDNRWGAYSSVTDAPVAQEEPDATNKSLLEQDLRDGGSQPAPNAPKALPFSENNSASASEELAQPRSSESGKFLGASGASRKARDLTVDEAEAPLLQVALAVADGSVGAPTVESQANARPSNSTTD